MGAGLEHASIERIGQTVFAGLGASWARAVAVQAVQATTTQRKRLKQLHWDKIRAVGADTLWAKVSPPPFLSRTACRSCASAQRDRRQCSWQMSSAQSIALRLQSATRLVACVARAAACKARGATCDVFSIAAGAPRAPQWAPPREQLAVRPPAGATCGLGCFAVPGSREVQPTIRCLCSETSRGSRPYVAHQSLPRGVLNEKPNVAWKLCAPRSAFVHPVRLQSRSPRGCLVFFDARRWPPPRRRRRARRRR